MGKMHMKKEDVGALVSNGVKHKKMNMIVMFLLWRLSKEPAHGYGIMRDLKEFKMASFMPSTIYAVLSQIEAHGLIKSKLESSGGRVRKVYYTSAKGMSAFEKFRKTKIKGIIREFTRALSA